MPTRGMRPATHARTAALNLVMCHKLWKMLKKAAKLQQGYLFAMKVFTHLNNPIKRVLMWLFLTLNMTLF